MKRKLGKFLAVAAMMPCALFATACGEKGLDEEKAFASVKSAMTAMEAYDGSLSTTMIMNSTYSSEDPYKTKSEMGYNKETGEYYEIETQYEDDEEVIDEALYVKKVDNKYVMYEEGEEYDWEAGGVVYQYTKSNVSSDHVAHEILGDDGGFDLNIESLTEYDTFAELKAEIAEDFSDNDFDLGEGATSTTTAKMIERNGSYILKIEMNASNVIEASGTEPKLSMSIGMSYEIEAKNNQIVGMVVTFSNSSTTGEGESAETESSLSVIDIDITYSYIDKMITDDSNYPAEAENPLSPVNFYLDNQYENAFNANFGTNITLSEIAEETSDITAYENTTIDGWYLDEECTQRFESMTMPSYHVNLYAKSKANEGYVVVVYDYQYEGEHNTAMIDNETVVLAIPTGEDTLSLTIPCYVSEHNDSYNNLEDFDVTYGTVVVNGENVTIPTEGEVTITLNEEGYYYIEVNSVLTEKPAVTE